MSTPETAAAEVSITQTDSEIIGSFLRVSGAYLFSCAYRDSLRAAYARHAAGDALAEHEFRYREQLACEAIDLVRTEWLEASALAARSSQHGIAQSGA